MKFMKFPKTIYIVRHEEGEISYYITCETLDEAVRDAIDNDSKVATYTLGVVDTPVIAYSLKPQ